MSTLKLLVLICTVQQTLYAQAALGNAAVDGTVRDPSGAPVPDAKVVLTETARGLSRNMNTNDAGAFRFPYVSPGCIPCT